MKKLAFFVLLLFLVACASQEPPRQVVAPGQGAPEVPPVQETVEIVETAPAVQSTDGSPQTVNVDIKDFSYQPSEVRIKAGDTVVWTQKDDSVKHNVEIVSGPESFKSELMDAGQTFSYTFTKAGEYSYKCTPHPNKMRGKVIVE